MKKEVDLTIIIPTYNVENFVLNALYSIKLQNESKIFYEVLIIDDGSKDNSKKLVKDFIEKNNLKNFRLIEKENGNWGSVINYAKSNNMINGNYITILDADDYFSNDCFSKIENVIKKNEYDLIFSNFYRKRNKKLINTKVMFTNKSKEVEKERCFSAWSIPLCKFFKKEKFLKMDYLKEKVSYQDQILFHNFVLNSDSFFFIKDNLGIYYENREGSSTSVQWDESRINLWCSNMNSLLDLNSKEIGAYVMMMINHCKNRAPKNLKKIVTIKKENIQIFKKSKFTWLPLGTRSLAKIVFSFLTFSIIKNSKK